MKASLQLKRLPAAKGWLRFFEALQLLCPDKFEQVWDAEPFFLAAWDDRRFAADFWSNVTLCVEHPATAHTLTRGVAPLAGGVGKLADDLQVPRSAEGFVGAVLGIMYVMFRCAWDEEGRLLWGGAWRFPTLEDEAAFIREKAEEWFYDGLAVSDIGAYVGESVKLPSLPVYRPGCGWAKEDYLNLVMSIADSYAREVEAVARHTGYTPPPEKRNFEHYRWLVLYQYRRLSTTDIATLYGQQDEYQNLDRRTVEAGIKKTAGELGIALTPMPRGRPKKGN